MHLDIQMLETEKEIVNSEPHFEERRWVKVLLYAAKTDWIYAQTLVPLPLLTFTPHLINSYSSHLYLRTTPAYLFIRDFSEK